MAEKTCLSASRIKTFQSCSWLYFFKYKLKAPDKSNDGAKRGSVCHSVFETLGEEAYKNEFKKIIKKQDIFASKKIKELVLIEAKKYGVDDEENMSLIKDMTLNGLNYDFYGDAFGKINQALSEKEFEFDVNEENINYRIKGFIDKLFIFNEDNAIVRDFKSSKEVFKGKDVEDNLQDLMYVLAAKKLHPFLKKVTSEFIFLKFPPKQGVIKMKEVSDQELKGFEIQLTEFQQLLDNFSEKDATKNLAGKKDYPKDGSFSGPLLCGFAKFAGEKKKDNTDKWHCSAKFAFDFYQIKDKSNSIIDSCFLDDYDEYKEKYPEASFALVRYSGCPHWNKNIDRS